MDKLLLLYYNITSFFGSRLLICDFFFWFRKINVYGGPSRLADSLLVTLLEVFFFFPCVKDKCTCWFFWLLSLQWIICLTLLGLTNVVLSLAILHMLETFWGLCWKNYLYVIATPQTPSFASKLYTYNMNKMISKWKSRSIRKSI